MHSSNMEDFWEEKESAFSFKDILFKYLRHWSWFILGVVLCGAAAWLYLQRTAPKYQVTATILIKDEKKGGLGGNEVLKELDMFSGSKIVDNEVEVLKSRNLLEKVTDKLNLGVEYAEEGTFRDEELFDNSPIRINTTKLNELAYEEPVYVRLLDEQNFELLNASKKVLGKFMYTQAIKSAYGTFRVFRNKDIPASPEEIKITFTPLDKIVDDLRMEITAEPISKNATVLQLGLETAVPAKG
jgi:tyrosine-protein kinase Etk/Wzc